MPSWRCVGVGWIHAREQVERSHRRLVNLLEIAAPWIGGRGFGEQDLGEPTDDGELILEVVTDLVVVSHRGRRLRCRMAEEQQRDRFAKRLSRERLVEIRFFYPELRFGFEQAVGVTRQVEHFDVGVE